MYVWQVTNFISLTVYVRLRQAPEGKWSPTFPKDVPIIGGNKEVDEGPLVGSSAAETTTDEVSRCSHPLASSSTPTSPGLSAKVRRQLDALASPKKRALWQHATIEGFAKRRAVLTRMCAIEQGLLSPDEDTPAGGDGEVASNINHNNSINVNSNNNISSSVSSSNIINNNNNTNNNIASNILLEDDALVTRQSKPDFEDASQTQQTFIITDQENVELMVTAAMKQIKMAVTDYLVNSDAFVNVD